MQLQKILLFIFTDGILLAACINNSSHPQAQKACKNITAYNNYAADSTADILYSNVIEIDTSVGGLSCIIQSIETQLPINAFVIELNGYKNFKLPTDNSGACQFAGIPAGDYALKISAPGYQCIELKDLHFGSGWVRTITVKLHKE